MKAPMEQKQLERRIQESDISGTELVKGQNRAEHKCP